MDKSQEYGKFCDRWLGAWTGNRPEELIEFYHPDAFYLDPARPKGIHGHADLALYFTRLLGANPDWLWRAREIFPTARGFTLKWEAEVPVKGEVLQLAGLDIVELEGDKIIRNEVYFDRTEWRAKLAVHRNTA